MARRFPLALSALASALILTACGGAQNAADETETRTALPEPETSTSAPGRPGSPSPSASATRTATAVPAPPASSAPASRPGKPSPEAASWTTARKSGEAAGSADRTPVIEAIRVGRHRTFHRVVFEFSAGTPEFTAEYTETLRQGGSGRKVAIQGEHVLLLVLRGVTPESHFDDTPATSVVRDVVTASIFEGDMRIGIGLDTGGPDRPGFRVHTFGDRLVLDFAHSV